MDINAQSTTETHGEPSSPLLTPWDVAKRLGLEETTLAAWRSNGRQNLPYVRVGNRIRYRPSDVASFIVDHVQAPPDAQPVSIRPPKEAAGRCVAVATPFPVYVYQTASGGEAPVNAVVGVAYI